MPLMHESVPCSFVSIRAGMCDCAPVTESMNRANAIPCYAKIPYACKQIIIKLTECMTCA